MKLYAYKQGSRSAAALAAALGIKRIKHEGGNIIIKDTPLINWGASKLAPRIIGVAVNDEGAHDILNHPGAVARAANKLEAFKFLSVAGVSVPEWTTSVRDASLWALNGVDVVVRHKLTGHSGEGIEILSAEQWNNREEGDDVFPIAPLYTKYLKKKEEYRIHVFQGDAFFIQRKARKLDVPDDQVNWKVRNLAGGFIFANKDVQVPDVAKQEAINAVAALGLDFGAVDIILGMDGVFYVLEVNTACGLEGTTLEKYVAKFQQFR